jgi:polar amino acid transport system substrate-binding protein
VRPLLLLFLVLLAVPVKAADSVLAPNGTLRAAYIGPNVAQARLDTATGTVSGVIADLARELGR